MSRSTTIWVPSVICLNLSFHQLWEQALSGLASHTCLLRSSPSMPNVKSGDLSHLPDSLKLCQMIWLELLSCHPQKLSVYKPSIQFSDCLAHHHLWIYDHLPYFGKVSDQSLVLIQKYCSDHSLLGNPSLFGIVANLLNLTKQSLHWTTGYPIGTCLDQKTWVQNTFAHHSGLPTALMSTQIGSWIMSDQSWNHD